MNTTHGLKDLYQREKRRADLAEADLRALHIKYTALQSVAGRLQMEIDEMTRNQVNLKAPGAYAELQRLAKSLGFVQTGGPRAGEGSVAKMMEAIARGELEVRSQVRSEPQSSAQNDAQEGATEAK